LRITGERSIFSHVPGTFFFYGYDGAGDLTQDASNSTTHTYQWDAEGRVASVDGGSTASFTYNALGHRVQRNTDGYFYDPEGNWLGTAGGLSFVRFGGRALSLYFGSETYFYHVNDLNSTAMTTNHAGTAVGDVVFYPWGDTWQQTGSGGYNFAGMPYYDTTTNTNETMYRFYSQNLGRWHSPDPLGQGAVKLDDPQTWNMYAYVRNNPTTLTDPSGLYTVACSANAKRCEEYQKRLEKQRQKDLKSKNIEVRNAAKAWGNFGDTGVTVTFKSQAEVDVDAGNTDPNVRVGAFVQPGDASKSDPTPDLQAEFSTSLAGSDLRQAIAHEGSHVEDMNAFLNSYDVTTGGFNPALNPTHFSTEFQAYGAGSLVKNYGMFPTGPEGYQQLVDWIYRHYPNADDVVFPPSMYPQ
jgi:RHS repeat-associated protein